MAVHPKKGKLNRWLFLRFEHEAKQYRQNMVLQGDAFAVDTATMRKKSQIVYCQHDEKLQNKNLQHLKPFVDEKGFVRVCGRLHNSSHDMECMNSIIQPKNDRISNLTVRYCHDVVAHGGRGTTMQEIRETSCWIINCNFVVRKVNSNYINCQVGLLDLVSRLWQIFQTTGSVSHLYSPTVVSTSLDPFLGRKDGMNRTDMVGYSNAWLIKLCTLKQCLPWILIPL